MHQNVDEQSYQYDPDYDENFGGYEDDTENERFMSTEDAFEIVFRMAQNEQGRCKMMLGKTHEQIAAKQQLALDAAHDFLVNNVYE